MWKRWVALLVVVLAGAGIRSRAGSPQAAPPEDGQALFITYCASCHGSNGHGDGPVADSLRVRPSDLTALAKRSGGILQEERIGRVVDGRDPRVRAHGTLEMPVWGDAFAKREGLSEAAIKRRIQAIVKFLNSIQARSGD